MEKVLTFWNENLGIEQGEEYQILLRALRWTEGFGLLFVECSPAQAERIIESVQRNIPNENIKVLQLQEPIDNLYDIVADLSEQSKIDILFIRGIEKSLVEYIRPGYGGQGEYYKEDTVPRILGHLNLQRERFRDNFDICFVFLLPVFALKYFIRRALDFYDWRSGVFKFTTEAELVQQESSRVCLEGSYQKYLALKPQERHERFLEIQSLLEEENQTPEHKAQLYSQQGDLLLAANEYEEAIASYDQALYFKQDDAAAWNNRGSALKNLGQYEEAIASYDKALAIKPDYHRAWNGRGNALGNLGRYEEALTSYDKVLEMQPHDHSAWYSKACCHALQGNLELAIEDLQHAISLSPDEYGEMAKTEPCLDKIQGHQQIQALIESADD